jgi:TolA-binding protein
MTAMASVTLLGLAVMGGLWPFGGDEKADRQDTIRSLERREPELLATPQASDSAALAREQYRLFLEMSADYPTLQMEAMRRLGDLNLEAGETKDLDGVANDAAAFYQEAIALYKALLAENPNYPDRDKIMYQLARAYEVTGEQVLAMQTLDNFVTHYPDSLYFDEAQFRRGEILFVGKKFAEAGSAYAAVISKGVQSSFYEQALYKHGWALFKQSRHEESFDSFMDLLDIKLASVDGTDDIDVLEQMSRPERELVDDSFRVLSISFSYLDGSATLSELLTRRGDISYANLLYAGLGDLYLDKERYIDAARTYADFVAHNPTDAHAPALQERVIAAYTLGKFPSLVLEAKQEYVEFYGLQSPFWLDRQVADWPEVVTHLKENLTDLASYDHAQAQETKDPQAYERAANWYRRFLDYFPQDPESAQRNFLLAEILYVLERYDLATEEYERTAYDYGWHEKAAEAGFAGLVSARKFGDGLVGEEKVAWGATTTDYALRFARVFPEHEQSAAVLTTVAEELFSDGNRERAIQIAGLVVTLQPPANMELERTAWTVIAHAQFDLQAFAKAEQAYQRLLGLPIADTTSRNEIEERIAASIYQQAEQAQAAGNNDDAVGQYLRVADVVPNSDVVPNAIFDAAALLITSEQWPESIAVLERFRAEFPGHAFNDDVTQKLAVARKAAGQKGQAAAEYERVAALTGVDAELHREALWQAVDLYAEMDAVAEQRRVYAEIVARYPEPLGDSIEARQHLADLARAADDYADRRKWLTSIVAADRDAGAARTERSRTLGARASLELAAPLRDAFLAVSLTMPLQDSLKLKKTRMETALAAYGATADYGVAEVTTAATFEIAELYYQLSRSLMNSERPESLTDEEVEQYDILLEEQAFPFEEQAIDIFKANVMRTADGIYDDWVRKSFSRLAKLMPARYAKSERSETLVGQLD